VSEKFWEVVEARFFYGVWRSTTFCGFQSGALGEGRSQSLGTSLCPKSFGKWSKLSSFLEFGEVQLFVVFKAELWGKGAANPLQVQLILYPNR
jgi:hypothetical protein